MKRLIRLVEVGPRDGLQNEKTIVQTKDKVKFIGMLKKSGLKTIEPTSFVNPQKVPQMHDAVTVYQQAAERWGREINLPALVPNKRGMENALKADVKEVAIFTAISNTFSKNNANATVDESLRRLAEVSTMAKEGKVRMRGYISTVFGCPYEGKVSLDVLLDVCEKLFKLGVYEISLGDTIGIARPGQVVSTIKTLRKHFDIQKFAMHFHDTRGMGLANVMAALGEKIDTYDASAGGLGGCPYAPGSTGNVCTEELVWLMDSLGYETGVDLAKLLDASTFMLTVLDIQSPSRLVRQFLKERAK
jgi:hydroxymethylglutaryl-CoA lyase